MSHHGLPTKSICKMKPKPKPKHTRRKTAPPLSTAAGSDQKFNTCCEYFKVKKSPAFSVGSRELTALEAGQETCGSSITADKTKTKVRDVTLVRPRRLRHDSLKQSHVKHQASSGLCIEDVQMLVEAQGSYDGGVNCNVCGKLYKSKVCFIKHIWEHTIYWDVFDKAKNHERVLSIQAAIILYSGITSQTNRASSSDLCNLLVTSPHSSEAKQERDSGVTPNNDHYSFLALLSEKCAEKSPLVVENGKDKSNNNAVENLLYNVASKYGAASLQNASSDTYIQTPMIGTSECWRQPSLIGYLQSDVLISPTLQTHSTLSYTATKLQTYPAVFFSPAKPNFYPAEISPTEPHYSTTGISPIKPHSFPTEISPTKPFSYPAKISPTKPYSYPAEKSLARPHSYPAKISPAEPYSYPARISPAEPYSYPARISLARHPSSPDEISPLTKPQDPFDISPPSKPQIDPTKLSAPKKPQSYPTLVSPPKKPQSYPTLTSPPPQQTFPIFSSPLPKPQTYPTSTSERVPILMYTTSLPISQLSLDACQVFKNSRHPSNDADSTLGSNGVSFVSPLKRKRED